MPCLLCLLVARLLVTFACTVDHESGVQMKRQFTCSRFVELVHIQWLRAAQSLNRPHWYSAEVATSVNMRPKEQRCQLRDTHSQLLVHSRLLWDDTVTWSLLSDFLARVEKGCGSSCTTRVVSKQAAAAAELAAGAFAQLTSLLLGLAVDVQFL